MILIYIAAAWVVGITLAASLTLPTAFWLLLLALPLGYLVIWWRDLDLRGFHVILLALVIGAIRFQLTLPTPSDLALSQFNDAARVSLVGTVEQEPDRRDAYTDLTVQVTRIRAGGEWHATNGRALVQAPRDTQAQYGDQIQVDGAPSTPPDAADFSYRDFLARESVFTIVKYAQVYVISPGHGNPFWTALYQIKGAALEAVATLFPEPSASLLCGILLGNDRGIPSDLKDAFNATNTAHIIAISGFNITLIAMYLGAVARRLFRVRPHLADWFVILALVGYTLLVGASASVVRAAIMGILGVIALRYGRQTFALNSLAVAVVLMTLLNPFSLWDIGFQLSFLATVGLLLYTTRLTHLLERALMRFEAGDRKKKVLTFLSDSMIVSVAAWITTTPLIIAVFHRLSIIGLLTNLLVLPAQPGIMVFGGLATLTQLCATLFAPVPAASVLVSGLAQVLAWCANAFLQYTILAVQWTARFPWAAIDTPPSDWAFVVLIYSLLLLCTRFSPRRLAGIAVSNPAWMVGVAAFATLFLWTSAFAAQDPRTHIQFVATTGGDAIFVRTARGGRILIDGSSEPSVVLAQLGQQMPFWDRRLDLIVATHLDEQNLASLNAVLERFTVGQALARTVDDRDGASSKKWHELLRTNLIPSTDACGGTRVQVDDVTIDVLYPPKSNASRDAALRLSVGNHTLLLSQSLRAVEASALSNQEGILPFEFAAFPTEFDQNLISRASPTTAFMFVGKSSREQPSPQTLKLLTGVQLLRTDQRGTMQVILNGDEVRVESEK